VGIRVGAPKATSVWSSTILCHARRRSKSRGTPRRASARAASSAARIRSARPGSRARSRFSMNARWPSEATGSRVVTRWRRHGTRSRTSHHARARRTARALRGRAPPSRHPPSGRRRR
jgi:hypothetical protein